MLYFSTNLGNTWDNWQTPILPIVDFNGDGQVGGKEVITMTQHWGQDEPLCDIAPYAWGNGVVDVEDLIVLAQHVGQEIVDPTLIAHWALDETEGGIACDSAGKNDGTVMGSCAWQPAGGQVDGALSFDGTTSVVADCVLDPAEGPFSVLAWIKGGAPGQAVVSQVDGKNGLMVDALEGTLATGLIPPTRRTSVQPLVSDTVITDDNWCRISFVWDGTSRALYVDDILVAEDIQDSLAGCSEAMNIGCDQDMTPGTFFSGLIDDVRIYNRAVRP